MRNKWSIFLEAASGILILTLQLCPQLLEAVIKGKSPYRVTFITS